MSDTPLEDRYAAARDLDYNRFDEFVRHRVQPPGRVFVTRDDRIILRIWSPIAALAWRVSIRWQDPDGRIIPQFQSGSNTTTGSTPFIAVLTGAEGFLLSATVETSNTGTICAFASLEIVRGAGSSDQTRGAVLICGNLGIAGALSYPQTPNTNPYALFGNLRTVTIANPGAGFEVFSTVPAGVTWKLRAISALFTADANVANRNVTVNILDSGAVTQLIIPLNAPLTAGTATRLSFAADLQPLVIVGLAASAPMPLDYRLGPGSFITTTTQNIQVGDTYTNVRVTVEEFVNF